MGLHVSSLLGREPMGHVEGGGEERVGQEGTSEGGSLAGLWDLSFGPEEDISQSQIPQCCL